MVVFGVNAWVRTEAEQEELFARLAPYEAVASMTEAPEGSGIWRLVQAATEAAATRDALEPRLTALRDRLAKAEKALEAANAKDDFAAVARVRAEIEAIAERLTPMEAELQRARAAAEEAALTRDTAWERVGKLCGHLRAMIPADSAQFRLDARGPHCWRELWELLGVPASSRQAA